MPDQIEVTPELQPPDPSDHYRLEPRHEIAPLERKRLAFHLCRMASEAPDGIPTEGWAKIVRGELESIPLDWVRAIEYAFPILTTILNKPRDLFDQSDELEGDE